MEFVHEMLPEAVAGQVILVFLLGFFVGALTAYGRMRRPLRREERV